MRWLDRVWTGRVVQVPPTLKFALQKDEVIADMGRMLPIPREEQQLESGSSRLETWCRVSREA